MAEQRADTTYRRRMDDPDFVERVVSLEVKVNAIHDGLSSLGDDLKAHILRENDNLREMTGSIQKLAFTAETHQSTLAQIAAALKDLVAQGSRITSLEEYRARAEKFDEKQTERIRDLSDLLEKATEKVERLYWVAGIVATLVSGAWSLLIHFKVL